MTDNGVFSLSQGINAVNCMLSRQLFGPRAICEKAALFFARETSAIFALVLNSFSPSVPIIPAFYS